MIIEIHRKIELLFEQKECIKGLVINPSLKWQERMSLYNKVRMINEQIQQLQTIDSGES